MTETVYAIASGKGGVGKTTTAVNVGAALARDGESVAVVDTDLGMANLAAFVDLDDVPATLHDVLAEDAPLADATVTVEDGLAVVPSGTALEGFAESSPEGLRSVVDELREDHSTIILDVGAGVTHETVLPLGLADAVVLVSTPEPAAVRDAEKTIQLTDRVGGEVAGLVLTRTRPNSTISHEDIAGRLGVPLLGTVPEDPVIRESLYAGTPLVTYAEQSPAAVAYRTLATTLVDGDDESTNGSDEAADESDDATDEVEAQTADETADETDHASNEAVSSAITDVEPDSGPTSGN